MAIMPGHPHEGDRGLKVLSGGRFVRPRLLVVDVDDDALLASFSTGTAGGAGVPELSPDEARALSHAAETGLEIAAVTAFRPGDAERAFEALAKGVTVLADVPLDVTCSAAERGRLRSEYVSSLCHERGIRLRDVAVIAARPEDRSMMFEAGVAFALETAGYDTCSAADAVFPSRYRGGLAAAVDAVALLMHPA